MPANFSKSQIDRLGDRLRKGPLTETDLRLLDDYRRSFGEAYESVVQTIREQLSLEPTGRPAKSTGSIIEKLRRESIRLSQMQDIAGCRIVVSDVLEQEWIVDSLRAVFSRASVADRRQNPSYHYRAVHVIAQIAGKLIEIQVRSSLQHFWAEFSEKLSDVVDPSIKYGGGEEGIRRTLGNTSKLVADFEWAERQIVSLQKLRGNNNEELQQWRQQIVSIKEEIFALFSNAISWLQTKQGKT